LTQPNCTAHGLGHHALLGYIAIALLALPALHAFNDTASNSTTVALNSTLSTAFPLNSTAVAVGNCSSSVNEGLQLQEALLTQAYSPGKGRQAVIITSCDHACLIKLFKYWATALDAAGNQTKHAIVVAVGTAAWHFCRDQLDKFCGLSSHHATHHPDSAAPGMALKRGMSPGSPGYMHAQLLKLLWIRAVLALNVTAIYVDMDMVLQKALLPLLTEVDLGRADLVVREEACSARNWDEGRIARLSPGLPAKMRHFRRNTGLMVLNPTHAAAALVQVWAGLYWQYVKEGGNTSSWNGTAATVLDEVLDQDITRAPLVELGLGGTLTQAKTTDGIEVWATRPTRNATVVFQLSPHKFQSFCNGICGCSPDGSNPKGVRGTGGKWTCEVPQTELDGHVAHHMNCLSHMRAKVQLMHAWTARLVTGMDPTAFVMPQLIIE